MICPFFCEATVVSVRGPVCIFALMPKSAWLLPIKDGPCNDTLPASTLCTISSSYPVYLILSWFSYSKVRRVFQSAMMFSLSPIVPLTFTCTSWLKSGSLRL